MVLWFIYSLCINKFVCCSQGVKTTFLAWRCSCLESCFSNSQRLVPGEKSASIDVIVKEDLVNICSTDTESDEESCIQETDNSVQRNSNRVNLSESLCHPFIFKPTQLNDCTFQKDYLKKQLHFCELSLSNSSNSITRIKKSTFRNIRRPRLSFALLGPHTIIPDTITQKTFFQEDRYPSIISHKRLSIQKRKTYHTGSNITDIKKRPSRLWKIKEWDQTPNSTVDASLHYLNSTQRLTQRHSKRYHTVPNMEMLYKRNYLQDTPVVRSFSDRPMKQNSSQYPQSISETTGNFKNNKNHYSSQCGKHNLIQAWKDKFENKRQLSGSFITTLRRRKSIPKINQSVHLFNNCNINQVPLDQSHSGRWLWDNNLSILSIINEGNPYKISKLLDYCHAKPLYDAGSIHNNPKRIVETQRTILTNNTTDTTGDDVSSESVGISDICSKRHICHRYYARDLSFDCNNVLRKTNNIKRFKKNYSSSEITPQHVPRTLSKSAAMRICAILNLEIASKHHPPPDILPRYYSQQLTEELIGVQTPKKRSSADFLFTNTLDGLYTV